MRKVIMTVIQMVIFVGAVFAITNTIEDNTYFGLIYGDIIENIRWILLGAMVLSVLNIWLWWPKARKVANTSSEKAQEGKSAETVEAKTADPDPVVPKMD